MKHINHLPDDFIHVKKFTNLDSMHQSEHSNGSKSSSCDSNKAFNNHYKRKARNDKGANDIDSIIISESIDQMMEETPNNIIYNH